MSDDTSSSRAAPRAANDHPLYQVDGGRTRRGLAIVAACALFWLAAVLLCFYS